MVNIKWASGFFGLFLLTGCAGPVQDLGIRNGRLSPCPDRPNCVQSQEPGEKTHIRPIAVAGTREQAKARLLAILSAHDGVTVPVVQPHYIRAEFRSALFKFVDDVEFYFPESSAGNTLIHVRSASRLGYSDFGANRKRIQTLRQLLNRPGE